MTKLQDRLQASGMSQTDFAKLVNGKVSNINRACKEGVRTGRIAARYAAILGCSPADLLEFASNKQHSTKDLLTMPQENTQFPRQQMTDAQWRDFSSVYLRAFETMPRKEAYAAAVREMRTEGKMYPTWGALLKRLRGVSSVTNPEPDASEPSESSDQSEAPSDKSALALDLLRCYRFRREQDLDALTDRLFPELGD